MKEDAAEVDVVLNMLSFLHVLWLMNSSSYCSILIYNTSSQIYIKAVRIEIEREVTFFLPLRRFSPNKMTVLNLSTKNFILTFCHLYILI